MDILWKVNKLQQVFTFDPIFIISTGHSIQEITILYDQRNFFQHIGSKDIDFSRYVRAIKFLQTIQAVFFFRFHILAYRKLAFINWNT